MKKGAPRLLRSIALTIAVLTLLLTLTGAIYQAAEARTDARRFPQEGRSVDAGGFKLNINCTGQGSPIVILESGLEDPAIDWRLV